MASRLTVSLAALVLLLAAGCGGGSDRLPPGGSSGSGIDQLTEEDVLTRVSLIEQALNQQETELLDDQFADSVQVGPNVRSRFRIEEDPGGNPLDFFQNVFEDNANFQITMQVESVNLEGSVGTAEVRFVSATTFIKSVPPTTQLADTTDRMVFTAEDDEVSLTVWKQDPPPTVD